MWDLTTARGDPDLPERHQAVVSYEDSHDASFSFE
ncbi:MAG: hypothetical protein QOE69_1060 [Thermoleophilaceae bacterium]|jgi:hypothetical protein|nr:hypothetical protein [Thermoleophilaceae bacterium]